ncbi:hypothetical protein [Alcaligenes faecalis]|uniref:hypothetical protein n=1 Tax=Alcaligenes faecalis TaxID=511 RepID=UPI00208F0BF7|nr:hypothetical protein [Alcaligenes faecalis]USP48971.1 hypothetical protein J5J84_05510 [Alcaligenes faecalis]
MDYSISLARLVGLAVLASLGGQAHAQVQSHELARADGSTIHYYVQPAVAPQDGVHELLLIVQGSDCNSVAHKKIVWETLAKARPQAQVLAVEKYALTAALPASDDPERSDCPTDYIQHDNPQQRVADLEAVLKQLQSQTRYDQLFALGGAKGRSSSICWRPGPLIWMPPSALMVAGAGSRMMCSIACRWRRCRLLTSKPCWMGWVVF